MFGFTLLNILTSAGGLALGSAVVNSVKEIKEAVTPEPVSDGLFPIGESDTNNFIFGSVAVGALALAALVILRSK